MYKPRGLLSSPRFEDLDFEDLGPGAWVQIMVLRTWIRTGPRGPLLSHALRTSIFLDLGSWPHGPDDISEDLDQDRPRGAFTLSCFEDLDF
jgi:hypothetical protein